MNAKHYFFLFLLFPFTILAQRIRPEMPSDTIHRKPHNKGVYLNLQFGETTVNGFNFANAQSTYFRKIGAFDFPDYNSFFKIGYRYYRHSLEIGVSYLGNTIGSQFNDRSTNNGSFSMTQFRTYGQIYIPLRYSYKLFKLEKKFNLEISIAYERIFLGDTTNRIQNGVLSAFEDVTGSNNLKQPNASVNGVEFGLKPTLKISRILSFELFCRYVYSPSITRDLRFTYKGVANQITSNSSILNFGTGLTFNF